MDFLLPTYDPNRPPLGSRLVRLIELNAYAAYLVAARTSGPLADWMRRCQEGDLVVEITTIADVAFDGQRLGVVETLEHAFDGQASALLLHTPGGEHIPWAQGMFVRVIDRLEVLA